MNYLHSSELHPYTFKIQKYLIQVPNYNKIKYTLHIKSIKHTLLYSVH